MSDQLDQLRSGLDEALRAINPGQAPVHAAVRRGKGIRARRRLSAFAGIAAIVVAGVAGYPALAHKQPAPAPRPPVAPRHAPSVTDVPPGPHAAKGEIASGTIYGNPWQIVTGKPGCFTASGSGIGQEEPLRQCLPILVPNAAAPVDFTGLGAGVGTELSIGRVLAGVRHVTVDLSDGTRLTLIPASVDGARYVAFAMPGTLTVASTSAYLGNGQIRTAIPFSLPQNLVMYGMWQRPGQPLPPRITKTIARGHAPQAWQATVYAGPWGTCLVGSPSDSMACIPAAVRPGTRLITYGAPGVMFGCAAANVSYLEITLTDGTTRRATAVAVGKQKWFAFFGNRNDPRKWTAYDAAGNAVSSSGPVTHS